MNSVKKMNELADKFAMKISRAQTKPETSESDIGPAVSDAFFDTPAKGLDQNEFMKRINAPGSNFQAAAGNVEGSIKIDVSVDSSTKKAQFIVTLGKNNPSALAAIKAALEKDYMAMFKKTPSQQFADRLVANEVRPSNIRGVTNLTTV